LSVYDKAELPMRMEGNVFLHGAQPSKQESHPVVEPNFDPSLQLLERKDGIYLKMHVDKAWTGTAGNNLVTSALLGKTAISGLSYESPNGSPIRIDKDYSGKTRNASNPASGPFESLEPGDMELRVW
jgi:hypothetical protein